MTPILDGGVLFLWPRFAYLEEYAMTEYNEWYLQRQPNRVFSKFRSFHRYIKKCSAPWVVFPNEGLPPITAFRRNGITILFYYNHSICAHGFHVNLDKEAKPCEVYSKLHELIKLMVRNKTDVRIVIDNATYTCWMHAHRFLYNNVVYAFRTTYTTYYPGAHKAIKYGVCSKAYCINTYKMLNINTIRQL